MIWRTRNRIARKTRGRGRTTSARRRRRRRRDYLISASNYRRVRSCPFTAAEIYNRRSVRFGFAARAPSDRSSRDSRAVTSLNGADIRLSRSDPQQSTPPSCFLCDARPSTLGDCLRISGQLVVANALHVVYVHVESATPHLCRLCRPLGHRRRRFDAQPVAR